MGSPYLYLPFPRLPGLLASPASNSLTRLRGRVRFKELSQPPSSPGPAYILDEELTSRLEAIRLEPNAAYSLTSMSSSQTLGTGSQLGLCKEVKSLNLRPTEESSLLADEEAV